MVSSVRSVRLSPRVADVGVACGTVVVVAILIAARQESGARAPDALAYLIGVAIALPLLVRRRWPLGGFLASVVAVIAYHALGYAAIGLAVPLAPGAYTAARAGRVRAVVTVFVGLELWAIGWRSLGKNESLLDTLGAQTLFEAALVAAILLLAEALRSRRAWAAEVAGRRVEQERVRIAREMHDVLAHTVAVIGVQAGVAEEALDDSPEAVWASLRTIREQSREAMAEIRAAVGMLREDEEAPRAPAPSLAHLPELVRVAASADLRVEVSIEGPARELPPAVDLTAFRIVQESLTNVLRHARATVATVSIGYEPRALVVEVADDGAGGAISQNGGHGLHGMRERAAALGGRLDAGPGPHGGFRVRARLPTGVPA